jgi:hypothetical protein
MDIKPKFPPGEGLPVILIIEILFFIFQLILRNKPEDEGVEAIRRKYGVSERQARELYRSRR